MTNIEQQEDPGLALEELALRGLEGR